MQKNKYRALFSNMAIFALSNVLSKIILALLLPLYTHVLTVSEYGVAELVTTIGQLLIPLCSLSIQDAVFRFSMDKHNNAKQVLTNSFYVLFVANGALFVCALILLNFAVVADWWLYFFIISMLTMWRSILSIYTKAVGKTINFSIDNVVYNGLLAGFNLLFLLALHFRLEGYFWALIVSNLISILYLSFVNRIWSNVIKYHIDTKLFQNMLLYSAPLIINSISWGITGTADKVMLVQFGSAAATGIYSVASKIPSLLSLVTGVFTQAWTLAAIQDYENEKDTHFHENIFKITHIGVICGALIIFLVCNSVLPFVLGQSFESATKYVPVLIIGAVFLAYSNFYSPLYAAQKLSKQIMYSAIGGAVLNVVLNALLIPRFDIMGACIATASSYIYIALFRMIDSKKHFAVRFDFRKWLISCLLLELDAVFVIFDYGAEIVTIAILAIVILIYKKEFAIMAKKLFLLLRRNVR